MIRWLSALLCCVTFPPGTISDSYQCPLSGSVVPNTKIEAQKNLNKCLMESYHPYIHPSKAVGSKVKVTTKISRITIAQMLNKEDYISMDIYVSYKWNDYRLKWRPSSYSDIEFVYVNAWKLWKPEIVLFDGRAETGAVTSYMKALVESNGDVTWAPQLKAHAVCSGDYSNFPYDTQRCKFIFQRQVYEMEQVFLEVANGNNMESEACTSLHNEWSVLKCNYYIENITLGTVKAQSLVLDVTVKRNYQYHQYVIILPSIILTLLVLSLYWVPHDSNQRFSLAGGLLFATLMANLMIQNFLPLGIGQVPVVVSYLLYIIIMLIITTIISLVTQNIASVDPTNHTMPDFIKKFLLNDLTYKITGVFNPQNQVDPPDASFENTNWKKGSIKTTTSNNNNNNDKLIDTICMQLGVLSQASSSSFTLDNPWKQLSMVVDRLFFFIFFLLFIIVTSSLYAH